MFDLPLLVPSRTLYDELGVSPDASDEEVRWAKAEAVRRLETQRAALITGLNRVRDEVPGLAAVVDEVAALRAKGAEADERAVSRALGRLNELEHAAVARDPSYREKCERLDALGRRIEDLNRVGIDRPDARLAHDRAHPPLAMLRLSDCTSDGFLERRTAIFFVRRALAAFLEAREEPVFHPSDLTRTDFSADFQPNPLLDTKGPHD